MYTDQEKLTTVRLGGALGKRFGKSHKFYISSPAEAIRALSSQIEGFAAYLGDETKKNRYRVLVSDKRIDPENELHDLSGTNGIRISPVIQGAKSGGLQLILGAALIGLAFWTGGASMAAWAGTSGAFATGMFGAGLSLALGGLAGLISPQPSLDLSESPGNTPNKNFSGPINTQSAGQPVPLAYGRVIIGSATVSAGLYASDTNG